METVFKFILILALTELNKRLLLGFLAEARENVI